MSRSQYEQKPLSVEAAQVIYDTMCELDAQIDKAKAEIDRMVTQIAMQMPAAFALYEKRNELAMELSRVADSAWQPVQNMRGGAMAAAPGLPGRFTRPSPFPNFYNRGPATPPWAEGYADRISLKGSDN